MTLAIHTLNLTRHFGQLRAVDGVDLQVESGLITGFLGPNGAGKTTIIRLLLGLLRPDQGDIELFGHSVRSKRLRALEGVGSLVEMPSLYPHLSGRAMIETGRLLLGLRPSETGRVLDWTGLSDAARRQVGHYSLGMRQRLGLALALLGNPRLLILDEPTNGLDPEGIEAMRALLRRLVDEHQTTVFLSSHRLSEIDSTVDRVAVVRSGKLTYQGSLEGFRQLAGSRLRVGVDRPTEAAATLAAQGWKVLSQDDLLEIDALKVEQAQEVSRLLIEQGFRLHHLELHSPSLESSFLSATATSPARQASPSEPHSEVRR